MASATITKSRGAVIVTRVSTGEQVKHGTSLESQRDACRAKAASLSLRIVAEYEDAGISGGFLLIREGMQAAIADIKAGRADTLICANISRYSRDVEHQQSIRKDVRAAGGSVVFCDISFDDTPEGDLAFDIFGGFAAYERKVIRARTMRGKRKRAEEGQQPFRSRAPYGYHIVTHADITRGTYGTELLGRYILRSETAPVAKRIFESYASGTHSLPKLCRELNTERIPTPGNGRAWQEPTLYAMLRNPVYKGTPISGRTRRVLDENRIGQINRVNGHAITTAEVRHDVPESDWIELKAPAIVNSDVWNAVQMRLPKMGSNGGGSPKQLKMLSGLVFCPACGGRVASRVQFANNVKYHYYRCTSYNKSRTQPNGASCLGDLYAIGKLETSVVDAILDAIRRPEAVRAAIQAYSVSLPKNRDTGEVELRSIDKALGNLRASEAAAVQAQIAGIRAGASADAYSEIFADIAAERKDLENRRGVLKRLQGTDQGVTQLRHSAQDNWHAAFSDSVLVLSAETVSGAEKRALIGTVIDKVVCQKDGADVYFLPGTFGENEDTIASRSTFQTTCIGIKTQK